MHAGAGGVEVLEDEAEPVSLPRAAMDLASLVQVAVDLAHKQGP